jgi:hypothetical protein
MKKSVTTFVLAGMAFVALLVGCDKIKDALEKSFDSNYEVEFTVEPNEAGTYVFETVPANLEQEILNNGGNIDNLKGVVVKECIISVVSEGRDLDAFKSFEVTIQAAGQAAKKIAWVTDVPLDAISVPLELDNDELQNILSEDEYSVEIKGVLDGNLEPAIVLQAKIKYSVTIGL